MIITPVTDHETDIKLCLDKPTENQVIGSGFLISGWIIEKLGKISSIEIYVADIHISTLTKFYERTDVQSTYPDYYDSLHSGFKKFTSKLPEGEHELKILATVNGKKYQVLSKTLNILSDDIKEFVIKCYRDILIREPDFASLESHVKAITNMEISQEQLPSIFRESGEYKQIMKNNGKIMKKRKKIMNDKRKIRKVRYGNISVRYTDSLDGGGSSFGQDFIPVVKNLFGKVPRICEFGSGPGFIGFSLLAHGLCDSLCLTDVNPEAVKICKETIKENKLEDKVSVYLSDGLSDVPSSEKWDLVVSNPPHFVDETIQTHDWILRAVDPDWSIHQKFYANIDKFLQPNGSILFQENVYGSLPWIHSEMIMKNNLELIDCFWHRKFNSSRDTFFGINLVFKELGRVQYYKKILSGLLKPSPHVFYFVWSTKKVNLKIN